MLQQLFVKFFQSIIKDLSMFLDFISYIPSSLWLCLHKLKQYLCCFLFNNHKLKARFKDIGSFKRAYIPFVTLFTIWNNLSGCDFSSKIVTQPIHEFFVGIYNQQSNGVIMYLSRCILALNFNLYGTFSVNNSCKIYDFMSIKHLFPYVICSIAYHKLVLMSSVNDLAGRILTYKGMRKSELQRKPGERESKNSFRHKNMVIKVTDCLNECAARLGVSLRQTEDQLTRDMLASTASFINCTGGVNGDNPTELTRSDVDDVVRSLLGNNAYTIMDNIEGEDKFGTAPVRDAYFALCHTDLTKDMDSVSGFIQKNQYPSPMSALRSEWGAIGNLRFLISSIGSITYGASNLNQNVYNIFCVGMEAYACVEQDGYSASFIYRPPIYDGPLALNASVGYKFAEVPRITNDLWVINLRCTLS